MTGTFKRGHKASKPVNFDALVEAAATNNDEAWRAEVDRYADQLRENGEEW